MANAHLKAEILANFKKNSKTTDIVAWFKSNGRRVTAVGVNNALGRFTPKQQFDLDRVTKHQMMLLTAVHQAIPGMYEDQFLINTIGNVNKPESAIARVQAALAA